MTDDVSRRFLVARDEIDAADTACWIPWLPKAKTLRALRALFAFTAQLNDKYDDLKEYAMTSAENLVSRLNAATDDIAGDLRTIRDQLAAVQAASESEKAAAVDAALAQFEGPIARLESLGRDETDPVPDAPAEPPADVPADPEPTDETGGDAA